MKSCLSRSFLILPLFALVSAHALSAQSLVVDKPSLTFSGQFGGAAATQTVNLTSSTGTPISFNLAYASPWLKVNGQALGYNGTTSAALTVTADPTGLASGTYNADINITSTSATATPPIKVTFTVSTIGVTPQSLAFSYTLGSNNFPAAQNLILNSAAGTQCTVTGSTASGGNWLGPLQSSCVSPSIISVPIASSVVASLAANTYTGSVTITPPTAQDPPVVVPVTLTVLPTPPVTVNPTSLILNWQTGTAAPSQTFTVATTSTQALAYSFVQSPGALSGISTVTPPSGTISATTPAQITYAVTNPAGLAVGTYTGKLTLFTFGGTPPQQDINITLNVSNTALLNVPNTTLNFTGQVGSTPAPQTVNITATSGTLSYSVTQSANSAWLTVPNAGTTATPLTVSVNPAGLAPGTYNATINVRSAIPGSADQPIPVVLKITNDPVVSASVRSLAFPYQIGQTAAVAARNVKITSVTGVPLNYTATLSTTTCGSGWLQAAGVNGTLSGRTDDTLRVSVTPTGLAAGTCTGKVTIAATNPATGAPAVGSPFDIDVTLSVSATAQLVLTPADPPVFTLGVGVQSAAPEIVISSTNTDVLTYSVAFQSTGGWLSVNRVSGSTSSGNSLVISVNTTGLTPGPYAGTVTITAAGPGGAAVADSPVTIPITLNVTAGSLTLSASSINFQQTVGGPAPDSQTVTVGSTGQPLPLTAVADSKNAVTWLSVTPASGTTNATLTIAANRGTLPAGTYDGTVVVTSPGAGNSPATINVRLKVDPGTISAPTTTLTFTQATGGPVPAAQSIAVTGSPAPLNFTVAASMVNGTGWLTATPATGTTPGSVQVSVNGAALPVAQYTGTVTIASPGANGSPIAVGVILNVVAPAVLAASPNSLSFDYTIGLTAPAAQNVAVTSTPAGAPLTTQVEYDGATVGWLSVAPSTGIAPATLAVTAAPQNLPAGKYTGRVVIVSPISLAKVTIPVTFTVASIPQPVVAEVRNAASYLLGGVSPGENIWIKGTGLGPAELVKGSVANDAFITKVANTRVLFDNVAVPIIYASETQTSVMVPYGVQGRTSTTIVVEYGGVQSAPVQYNVVDAAPGIYTMNSSGSGPAAVLNQDGVTVNGAATPEKRGNVIAVYMTGEGSTSPQGTDGAIIPGVASALKKPILKVTATIGGVAADVEYAGSAPTLVSGVMQVNLRIPATAPTGNTVPIVVNVGTATSSAAGAPTVAISQ